jgi:mono/diheme cytochrome c family protein
MLNCTLFALLSIGIVADSAAGVDFERSIRPVLAARCFSCHGPDGESRKAGLRLDTFEGATAALRSGKHAIVAGDPDASEILVRVAASDPDDRMPPEGHERLTDADVASIRAWIAAGAEYTAPWAFRPIIDGAVPAVRDTSWPRTDIDRFALASREALGAKAPARDVAPASLLRRASFDIVGLPPSEADLRAFTADPSDTNFAAYVDRALASPQFGERWGRHWLDLARYAETLAHEFDYEIPDAWRYRDYVIDAFNRDLPPARFVAEQIAGDMLEPRAALGLTNAAPLGTAYWFLGPATHSPVDVRVDEADRIAGSLDVLGRSLLGLTVACARCHDHKFDPIPTKDFYALAGVARNTRRVETFLDSDMRAGMLAQDGRMALDEAALAIGAKPQSRVIVLEELNGAICIDDASEGGAAWSRSGHAFAASAALVACATDGSLRLAETGTVDSARLDTRLVGSARSPSFGISKRYLHVRVRGASSWVRVLIDNYWLDANNGLLFEGMRRRLGDADAVRAARDPREWEWHVETFDLARFPDERAYIELTDDGAGWIEVDAVLASDDPVAPPIAAWDIDETATAADPAEPGSDAARSRALAARDALLACSPPVRALVAEDSGSFDEPIHVRGSSRAYGDPAPRAQLSMLRQTVSPGEISGSGRASLARDITNPDNPFLWRTLANRVWLKLFGRAIVDTPDDFGQLGASPWSPALLDHLAAKLARGITFKQLIREVVLSRAYRAEADAEEPPSFMWTPLAVRRLDAEAIRDAMLAASGRIDLSAGGPSVPARLTEHMQGRGRPGGSGPVDGAGRRSIYIAVRRNFLDPFMQAFDQPIPATTCGKRHSSNVPAQALALLNSELAHNLADFWGGQLEAQQTTDEVRIAAMWMHAYARAPGTQELQAAQELLRDERAARPDAEPATREAAAFGALAHALFSTKEFVFLR